MSFFFSCIPFKTPSSFPTENPTTPDVTASSSSVNSTSSSSSSSASALTTASSDVISIQTFPSLPTLHSFLPSSLSTPPPTSSFSLLSSLNNPHPQTSSQSAPALALSNNLLFSFSSTSTTVYDLTSLRQLLTFAVTPSSGAVKSAVSSNSNPDLLLTAHQDGKIRTWSNSNSKLLKIRAVATLPTLTDRLLRLPLPSSYVTVRRHHRRLWIQHADAVSAVAVNGNLLYSVSWDKTLKIWRLTNLKCLESITAHDDAVNAVAVAPDGTVFTGSADRTIKVWAKDQHVRRHVLVATLVKHKSAVNCLAVSEDGHVLYSGACDRSILVWEREGSANFMAVRGALRGHGKAVLGLATVGMGVVVSGSSDQTVRIWRRGEGEGYSCLCVLRGHVRGVRSVVVQVEREEGEESYRVCSGSFDGEVRVWRVRVEVGKPGSNKE